MDLDIQAYAALVAALARAGDSRAEVLGRHGLDEASWDTIDSEWQTRLSEAWSEDGDGVPDLIARFSAAYAAAQRAMCEPMPLEQFAEVTRLLQASGDLRASLAKVGAELADYVRAAEHWPKRMAEDPALERQFDEVLKGRTA